MYPSFVHPILDPVHHLRRAASKYLRALRICLLQIVYSPAPVFVFMWLMAWRKSIGQVRQMLGRAAVWSIIRLLMFPNTDDRFVVWAYILIAITMLTTIRKQRIPVLPKSNNMEAFQPEKLQPF